MRSKIMPSLCATLTLLSSALPVRAEQYKSWIDPSVLADNHRAYCSDIAGQHQQNDVSSVRQNNSGSNRSSSSYSHSENRNSAKKQNTGGGVGGLLGKIVGFNAGVQYDRGNSSQVSTSSNTGSSNSWDRSRQVFSDKSESWSETVGQNCDAFVQGAAARDIAKIGADAQTRIQIFQGLTDWRR